MAFIAPQTPSPSDPEILDAIVIGGGPAGLSAALVFGRCLRRVLVCDAGHPRNEPARIFNGFLSRDASSPSEFLQICRDQLRRYETIQFRKVKVADVERGDCRFTAILETGERVASRMLLLATGLIDELPQIENFQQFYGSTVHNCPFCDGWECRGQPMAVTGGNQDSVDLAIELLLWSKDLVLCTNGPLTCDRKTVETLRQLDIWVIDTPIFRLEGHGDKLEGIRFTDGKFLPRSALFFSPGQYQRSHLAERLGCEFCEDTNCIQCGENAATNIPAFMLREMPVVARSLSLQQLPKAWRRPSLSIMPCSRRILRVMRCAMTSPAKLRLLIALRLGTKPLTESPRNSLSPLNS